MYFNPIWKISRLKLDVVMHAFNLAFFWDGDRKIRTWKTSLRCVSNGGDDTDPLVPPDRFLSVCSLFLLKTVVLIFAFLYVMSCPVTPLQVFPYPWFIILCLYSFFSVIHGWVCWVSWSCQFVILIWNSFTIIGSSRCPVCFFFGGLPFHTCGLKCPQLMHVLTCCLEWHTAHACPS